MNVCSYCFNKNMSYEEYEAFKAHIKSAAKKIRKDLTYNGGMYYDTSNLFKNDINTDINNFIIKELKEMDIEFMNNNALYRVVD